MKTYFHTLKQYFRVEGENIGASCVFLIIGGVIGMFLTGLLIKLEGDGECVPMGTIIATIVAVILAVLLGINELPKKFNLSISMGKTRKSLIFSNYILEITRIVLYFVIIGIISRVEIWLYGKMYPGVEYALVLHKVMETPVIFFSVALALPILVNLLGALFMRFGQKFYWVFWVLWMVSFTVGPRLFSKAVEEPDSFLGRIGVQLIAFLENANRAGLVAALAAIGTVAVFITVKLLRRQWVTS